MRIINIKTIQCKINNFYFFKGSCNIIKMLTKKAQNLQVPTDMSGKN